MMPGLVASDGTSRTDEDGFRVAREGTARGGLGVPWGRDLGGVVDEGGRGLEG